MKNFNVFLILSNDEYNFISNSDEEDLDKAYGQEKEKMIDLYSNIDSSFLKEFSLRWNEFNDFANYYKEYFDKNCDLSKCFRTEDMTVHNEYGINYYNLQTNEVTTIVNALFDLGYEDMGENSLGDKHFCLYDSSMVSIDGVVIDLSYSLSAIIKKN